MSFWNYIGEFLLFRWLFGAGKQDVATRNVEDTSMGMSSDESHYNNSYSRFDNNKAYGNFRSDDYFHDEQDDYDMMDGFYVYLTMIDKVEIQKMLLDLESDRVERKLLPTIRIGLSESY